LAPVRSHYWITESRAPFDSPHPILIMPDARAYARPEIGRMLFGIRDAHSAYVTPDNLPADIAGFSFDDDHSGWGALQAGIGPLLRYCPALEYTGIEHYISGPSAYTPDGSFVIGPVSDLEGFIAVTGCCGAGIAHSAGFGRSAAALALGLDLPYDLTPYRPERFGEFDPLSNDFCYRCAASRSAKTAA
jgi:4-methylaminobutanoate oxidase (formaldehyde-forming)